MPERSVGSANYRYAFNGMEKDDEVKGNGNSYTTTFRQYDPRLGRWKSLDPLMSKYPQMSPYVAFNNNPIYFIDPDGLEGEDWVKGGTSADGKKTYDKNTWHWEADVDSKSDADAIGANDWIGKDQRRTIVSGGKKVTLSYDEHMDNGRVEWQNTEETAESGISPFLWSQVDDMSVHFRPILNKYVGMNFLGNKFTDKSLNWDSKGMNRIADMANVVAFQAATFAGGEALFALKATSLTSNVVRSSASKTVPEGIKVFSSLTGKFGKSYQSIAVAQAKNLPIQLGQKLNSMSPGSWSKIYEAGILNGSKVEVHYFYNATTRQYINPFIKMGEWGSRPFKGL